MFPVSSWWSLLALEFFRFFTMIDSPCLCCFTQLELWYWAVFIWPAETGAPYEWGVIFAQLFAGCAVYFRKNTLQNSITYYLMPLPFSSLARVSIPADSWKSEPSHSLMITAAMREPLWALTSLLYILVNYALVCGSLDHKAHWIYLKKDCEFCIDKGFGLFALHLSP